MDTSEILLPDWAASHFQAFERELNGGAKAPLHARRREAFAAFRSAGIPRPQLEEWKYTDITSLAGLKLDLPPRRALKLETLVELFGGALPEDRAVFVDGRYEQSLSKSEGVGAAVWPLAQTEQPAHAGALRHLSRIAGIEAPLVALNTGFLRDGALIVLEKGVRKPLLSLIFVHTGAPAAVYPRVLIVAERGAQGAVVEHYLGRGAESYFTNAVSEVLLAEGAALDHYKVQREGGGSYHCGALVADLAAGSVFSSSIFSFGGGVVRNEMHARIGGSGATCSLNGLTVLGGAQHVDNHTVLDHRSPHSQSDELFKGIYADEASGAFSGTIIVRPDAQKTNAYQSNQSLLLSPKATVETRPQLKIWADDVKCTHGATVGQIDEEALFYIRSRGISRMEARHLLIHAFASDVNSKVKETDLHALIERELGAALERSAAHAG